MFLLIAFAVAAGPGCADPDRGDSSPERTDAVEQATVHRADISAVLSAKNATACAAQDNGSLWCWGTNGDGKLGTGSVSPSDSNVPLSVSGLPKIISVGVGDEHVCASTSTGTVYCWGNNSNAQMGTGANGSAQYTPTAVPGLTGVLTVVSGYRHSCALKYSGKVTCWGDNNYGQVGDGTALNSGFRAPTDVVGISTAVGVTVGANTSCAILADGTTGCWGSNATGNLGNNTITSSSTPVRPIGVARATSIASGTNHACASLADGTVMCWGENGAGQLGDGTTTTRLTPITVPALTNVSMISAGTFQTCAVIADGTGKCWGANGTYQLGDTTTVNRSSPVVVSGLTNAVAFAASAATTCALRSNGGAQCWGSNTTGVIGNGTYTFSSTPTNVSSTVSTAIAVQKIVGGSYHTCALAPNGTVKCWGNNVNGQLGIGNTTDQHTALTPVSGLTDVIDIAGGYYHNCALRSDGQAFCWGNNASGQLGNGTNVNSVTPVAVQPAGMKGVRITAGGDHTCMILADGTARCWGSNSFGELGDGTTTSRTTATIVNTLANGTAISAGYGHTCALSASPGVWCWGYNLKGQVGDGTLVNKLNPVNVAGLTSVVSLSTGYLHSCVTLVGGSAKCWGFNNAGQLGNNTTTTSSVPVAVIGTGDYVAMADIAGSRSCAIRASGAASCWGTNSGQLGDGTIINRPTPVSIGIAGPAVAMGGGFYGSCAILDSGSAQCWGSNSNGQVGDGTTVDQSSPVSVNSFP